MDELIARYVQGEPIKTIARDFGINTTTIYYQMRIRGVRPQRKIAYLRPHEGKYPTSGDPDIIGEHEVPPVCCPHCRKTVPWAIIKGWR